MGGGGESMFLVRENSRYEGTEARAQFTWSRDGREVSK